MINEVYEFLDEIPKESKDEIFETLLTNKSIKIERIVSYGQTTKEDYWYDQKEDELVVVLKGDAKIKYKSGKIFELKSGSSLYIKAHTKHQVVYTSNPTVWLAIFIDI